MLVQEALPQNEWAGVPLRDNEDYRQLWHAVDRSSGQWGRERIRHDGFSGRFERNLQRKRIHVLTLVAFGALAVTFAVLRCAFQRFPHRTAGDDERSLVEAKRVHSPSACLGSGDYGFGTGFVPGETLSEEQLQHRASGFMNSLVSVIKANEPVLARLPVQTRSKILSLLLNLALQELAALASVLDEPSRDALVNTVREVRMIIRRLGTTVTRRRGGVCSRRLQLFLCDILRRLEQSGPQGVHLPRAERLKKLHDLLRLQEVMLANLGEVFNGFLAVLSSGNAPSEDALNAAKEELGDLLHLRKEHIFGDPLLSKWLLGNHNQSKRFTVASPGRLVHLRQRAPRTVEEMIDELMALSAGGGEQRRRQQLSAPADEAAAYPREPGDLPSSEDGLQTTAMSTVLLGNSLGSGHALHLPNVSGEALSPEHAPPAAWEGRRESGPSRLILSLQQRSNESVPTVPSRHTQWSETGKRTLIRGSSPAEPFQEVFIGAAVGEPVPRAPTQQNNAEDATANPFNLPDIFDSQRGRVGMSLK